MWEIECYWNSCWDTIIPRLIANHIQACTWDLFLTWKLLYVTKKCQKLPICYHMFHKSECLTIFSEAEHCCWEQSGEPPLKKNKCFWLFNIVYMHGRGHVLNPAENDFSSWTQKNGNLAPNHHQSSFEMT